MKQGFPYPLITVDEGGDSWSLYMPFSYVTKGGDEIVVPSHFITDFLTVPKLFRGWIPKVGKFNKSAVIHDWLCKLPGFDRDKADLIFKECLEFQKGEPWEVNILYSGAHLWTVLSGRVPFKSSAL